MSGKILVVFLALLVGFVVACKTSNDAKITTEIKTKYTDDSRLDAAKIDVDTKDGIVTLNGKVLGKQEETRAIEIARAVPGVTDVVSKLEVENNISDSDIKDRVEDKAEATKDKLDEHNGHETVGEAIDDAGITTKVKLAFAKDPEVSAFKIDVDTKNGVVTLSGNVKSSLEAKRAISVAETVDGVKSVNSVLTVGS